MKPWGPRRRSGQRVIAHTSISKCSVESIVYPASLRTAQEKLHETPRLPQRSARLRPDLKRIHLSTPWPDLTWMSRSSAPEPSCSVSLQFLFPPALVIALTFRRSDGKEGVRASACSCSSVYMQRRVVAHMRKAAEGYLVFSNILHCV